MDKLDSDVKVVQHCTVEAHSLLLSAISFCEVLIGPLK
jgi:hypothetical protein